MQQICRKQGATQRPGERGRPADRRAGNRGMRGTSLDSNAGLDYVCSEFLQRTAASLALRILVIEDDEKIGATLLEVFARQGYTAELARTGEDGFFRWSTHSFDLVVLDLGLPGRDGLEILAARRKINRDCLVLILSAQDGVDDRVRGLAAGADDYLVKPFAVAELLARIEALLRRGRANSTLRLNMRDLHVDLVTRRVDRAGRRIDLTPREFNLLEYLMRHSPAPVSREMLAHEIWKDVGRATPLDNVIDVHIARLRRKVDGPNLARLIHTVRGVGFCLGDAEPD
jgi:two-component system copper resistance phosphate regulon response regulator CusR